MNEFLKGMIRHKSYTTFIFTLLLCLFLVMSSFTLVENYRKEKLDNEWDIIEDNLERAIAESERFNQINVEYIERKIKDEYKSNSERLEEDLSNLEDGNILTSILAKSIKDDILFDMDPYKADNNDPFYMDFEKIVVDTSYNCSKDVGIMRDFNTEINLHYNEVLAEKAIKGLLDGDQRFYIWHFLEIDENLNFSEEIKDLKYADIQKIKNLFYENNGDYRVLQGFEFLVPKYIYRNKDLAGNPTISASGHKQPNYQLIIVQGFNIVDVIDHFGSIKYLDSSKEDILFMQRNIYYFNFGILIFCLSYLYYISKKKR